MKITHNRKLLFSFGLSWTKPLFYVQGLGFCVDVLAFPSCGTIGIGVSNKGLGHKPPFPLASPCCDPPSFVTSGTAPIAIEGSQVRSCSASCTFLFFFFFFFLGVGLEFSVVVSAFSFCATIGITESTKDLGHTSTWGCSFDSSIFFFLFLFLFFFSLSCTRETSV